MKAICPKNPKHKKFITTAHEQHEWVVNENGAFVEDIRCLSVTHLPDKNNVWICKTCGTQAKVE
jgi:hypothetical protein